MPVFDELNAVQTIVTHADCPDGIASALVLRDVLPRAEIVFAEHGSHDYLGLPAKPGMLFCDIIPPPQRSEEFVAQKSIVLDHHRAARDVVARFGSRGVFADEVSEPGVSGAVLAYREVWQRLSGRSDKAIANFARLAGVRDTWQLQDPDWTRASAQAAALLFFGFDALKEPKLSAEQQVVGERIVQARAAKVDAIAKKKWLESPATVACYNDRDRLLSDVAQKIFEEQPHIQVVAGFHYKVVTTSQLLLVFALRGRKGRVDVSAIAKANGGGGHQAAAGFSLAVEAASSNPLVCLKEALERGHYPSET